jgi:hypothetical protein
LSTQALVLRFGSKVAGRTLAPAPRTPSRPGSTQPGWSPGTPSTGRPDGVGPVAGAVVRSGPAGGCRSCSAAPTSSLVDCPHPHQPGGDPGRWWGSRSTSSSRLARWTPIPETLGCRRRRRGSPDRWAGPEGRRAPTAAGAGPVHEGAALRTPPARHIRVKGRWGPIAQNASRPPPKVATRE